MKVDRYVEPSEFDHWRQVAEDMGFLYVASGPLVRSSYKVGVTPILMKGFANRIELRLASTLSRTCYEAREQRSEPRT